uniref:Uncharacterized protein n=1 Tax=Periophthalmus magnuspinnatus TaxID=409849 RepID=A0A3B4ASR7_9GOBI
LLDEVVQWSPETCRQELKSVLPKLAILKVITDMFLPHIGLSELEDECFSKVLPKAATVFDSMLKEILDQVGGLSSQNTELCAFLRRLLESMMQLIDSLSACVRHVGSFDEAPYLDTIRSLPTCVLKILKDTFQHCKDSEVVYCGRLSLVADLLQALFKAAYSLQKGLLEVLDRVSLDSSASDEEVSDIVTIHSLLDICSIISNLDVALHANTWKFLIHSLKYHSLVEEHLHHRDISAALCDNLSSSFQYCLEMAEQMQFSSLQETSQTAEQKLFQKSAKMCRFFGNTLVHYIKEFGSFMTKCCHHFYQLYLQKFPPNLSSPLLPPGLSEELNVAARIPLDALLFQLLPLRAFAEAASQCLLLVSVMDQLGSQPEDVQQLWYTGSLFSEEIQLPLYEAVLSSFRRCYTECRLPVLLPGVMMNGQAQASVTLHQHVCVHLCASVAALQPAYFSLLEQCLVRFVLQPDTHCALLAIDTWCFTVYGTAELCLHHALLIGQLPTESYQCSHLGLLLRRMAFLLTPNHQIEFVKQFPPSVMDNLPVWSHVLLKAFSQETQCKIQSGIVKLAQKSLDDWHKDDYKLGQVNKMQIKSHAVLQCTLELLLLISSIVVKNMESQVICQAVVSVKSVDELLLATLEFLSSLGKIFVPPDFQSQILPRLSSLFRVLLISSPWLVQHHALEAFSRFAESTNHEEVISQSLSEEETKAMVVNYLSKPCPKRPRQETIEEDDCSRHLQTAERALKA